MTERLFTKNVSFLLMLSLLLISGCSGIRHSVADMMIGHELRKAGLKNRTIDVNGNSISIVEGGRGDGRPTVLLIHGFGANKENWVQFAGYLTDSCHVIAIDLPGHGQSVKRFDIDYSIENQADYLYGIVKKMELDRFHVAGNSMGGAISSVYAARYPEHVQSLTLMNSGGIYDHDSEMTGQLKQGGENPLIVENREDFDRLMNFALEKKPFIPWPLKGVFAENAVSNQDINKKIFMDIAGQDSEQFKNQLAGIKAPTLIIWGRLDRVLSVENADEFARCIKDTRIHIFEDVGHAPMIEVPEAAANLFENFVLSTDTVHSASVPK